MGKRGLVTDEAMEEGGKEGMGEQMEDQTLDQLKQNSCC